jgi:hypothetical protein
MKTITLLLTSLVLFTSCTKDPLPPTPSQLASELDSKKRRYFFKYEYCESVSPSHAGFPKYKVETLFPDQKFTESEAREKYLTDTIPQLIFSYADSTLCNNKRNFENFSRYYKIRQMYRKCLAYW